MPIVYLLRHAQSVANTKGILAGQDDTVALSRFGQKQAQTLVAYLENIKFEKSYVARLSAVSKQLPLIWAVIQKPYLRLIHG